MTRTDTVYQRLRDPQTHKATLRPVMVVKKRKIKDGEVSRGLPELPEAG